MTGPQQSAEKVVISRPVSAVLRPVIDKSEQRTVQQLKWKMVLTKALALSGFSEGRISAVVESLTTTQRKLDVAGGDHKECRSARVVLPQNGRAMK